MPRIMRHKFSIVRYKRVSEQTGKLSGGRANRFRVVIVVCVGTAIVQGDFAGFGPSGMGKKGPMEEAHQFPVPRQAMVPLGGYSRPKCDQFWPEYPPAQV